ncbi:DUF58 domain-containing protein [Haloarcula litorea]|uniref:DUF58 domain-containing protein n=1 Tax=Haloarcula litorea TaxID=3032579 RepID=UPI0023E77702|nr:DUF58 domain-containing protein [Halomicroarcula sp. GDY20]
MSYRRLVVLAAGVTITLVGVAGAVTGAFAFPMRPGVVVFVGVFAVTLAGVGAYRGRDGEHDVPALADRSGRSVTPPDRATDGFGQRRRTRHHQLAGDLREIVERGLRDRPDTEAADALAAGTWTDDGAAAAAFTDEVGRGRQLRDRLRALRAGRSRLAYRVDRAAAAVRGLLGLSADDADPEPTPTAAAAGVVETDRWRGFRAVPLAFVGVGILARQPGLVVAAAVPVVALAVSAATRTPEPDLTVERAVEATDPTHGDEVVVRLTVRNEGDHTLLDCRVGDGVPDALAVVEGSPQVATALRPGATATVEYTVRATRGDHAFETPHAVVGDGAGRTATVTEPSVTGDAALSVGLGPSELDFPVRSQTTRQRGRIAADEGGEGIAFYATREYRPGDPLSRIDWNRYAGTRELSTLEFREERSATVVVLVDARPAAYHAPADPTLDGTVDRSVVAARAVADARLAAEDRVGLAALSVDRLSVPPGSGPAHRSRLTAALDSDALGPTAPEGSYLPGPTFRWLRRELPGDAQVVCCSPLTDDDVVRTLRYLSAYGHHVTVVSPDPGTRPSAEGTVAAARRLFRVSDLRRHGVPVVDWGHDESLAVAVERHRREGAA